MSKRKLPLWMQNGTADDGRMADKSGDVPDGKPTTAVIRQLRSNFTFPVERKEPPPSLIEYLPFIEYTGAISHYTDMRDIAFTCDQLVHWVEQRPVGPARVPVSFDLEWPFNFKDGAGRTALMQLCVEPDHCYLLQVSCLKRLPAAVLQLLTHPRVTLHGVNVKNDCRKLARDFPEVDGDKLVAQCTELGQWYNRLHGSTGLWSLERLVAQVLKQRISKAKHVRMSQWHVLPLSADQQLYAAIDVYAGHEIYRRLQEKEQQLLEQQAATDENCLPSGCQ